VQEGDAARGMEVLRTQMMENITAQQGRLDALQLESQQIENSLQHVAAPARQPPSSFAINSAQPRFFWVSRQATPPSASIAWKTF